MKKLIICLSIFCLVIALSGCVTVNKAVDRLKKQVSPEKSSADTAPKPYGSEKTQTAAPTPPQREIEFVVQVMKTDQPLCFSPDGRFVVTTGINKHNLQLWQMSTGRLVRTFAPDRSMIEKVTYGPKGRYLMVINLNHDIRLVEVKTGKTVGFLDAKRSGARVVYAGFTRDGRHALIKRHPGALGAVVSAKDIFKPKQNSPRLFTLESGAEIRNYMIADITEKERCVLTADGRRFLAEVGHSQFKRPFRLEWFDVATGQSLGRVPLKNKYRFGGLHFTISPDARYLVTSLSDVKKGKMYDQFQIVNLETGEIRLQQISGYPQYIQFSPDGRYLFYQPIGGRIFMTEIDTGKLVHKFVKNRSLASFAIAPTGNLIAYSNEYNSFVLTDYAKMKEIRVVSGIGTMSFGADVVFLPGHKAYSALSATNLLNLTTGEIDQLDMSKRFPYKFSGDGKRALMMEVDKDMLKSGGHYTPKMSLRHWPSGKLINTLKPRPGYIWDLSHNGRVALWGEVTSMEPVLWDLEKTDAPVKLKNFPDQRTWLNDANIALSPDGRLVAAAVTDNSGQHNVAGYVYVWDTATGKRIEQFDYRKRLFSFDSFSFDRLVFSPDNRYLVVAMTERKNKWEGKTGTWLFGYDYQRTLIKHHIEIWDLDSGYKVRTIKALGAPVTDFAFSPDGAFLFSGATNGVVTRWEFKSGRRVKSYFTPSSVSAIAVSPDGRHMLVQGFALSYWEVDSGKHLFNHVQKQDLKNPLTSDYLTWTPAGYYRGSDTLAREYCHLVHGMKTYALDRFFEQFYNPAMIEARVKGLDVDALNIARVLIDSPPPTVSFSKPVICKNGLATVKVFARDTGGGVRQIRLYHNGKRIGDGSNEPVKQFQLAANGQGIRDRGIAVVAASAVKKVPDAAKAKPLARGDRQQVFQVRLLSGENQLRASAFSSEMIESEPETVSLSYKGRGGNLPHLHVVAIGIHQYRQPVSKLPMAKRDAEGFVQKLTQTAPALFRNYKIASLYDAKATRAEILKAMAAVAKKAKPEDMVVFFFAGHGVVLDDDGRFYLVAHGVRDLKKTAGSATISQAGVSDLVLGAALQKIPALKQVVFMDACQSGGANFADAFRNSGREVAIKRIGRAAGTWIFSAAGKTESAYETQDLGHGLFTYALLAGLEGKADGTKGDGTITLSELETFVTREVAAQARRLGINQKPIIQRGLHDFSFSSLP